MAEKEKNPEPGCSGCQDQMKEQIKEPNFFRLVADLQSVVRNHGLLVGAVDIRPGQNESPIPFLELPPPIFSVRRMQGGASPVKFVVTCELIKNNEENEQTPEPPTEMNVKYPTADDSSSSADSVRVIRRIKRKYRRRANWRY